MNRKNFLVQKLELLPHPEGGFFKETYRSVLNYENELGKRNLCTGIYFLLEKGNFSAFHKIKSEELWHFYEGASVEIIMLYDDEKLEIKKLGKNLQENEHFQVLVPANVWFGSRIVFNDNEDFALVGCTVSFGFDFEDFELAEREFLLKEFPQHKEMIIALTR